MTATEVDARGMRCPWPALRLAKAMRGAAAVRLLVDDPAAPREVAALAAERGWTVTWEGEVCLVTLSSPAEAGVQHRSAP